MLNITSFGIFHTAVALVAVAFGLIALFMHGEIGARTQSGRLYVWLTAVTAITGLFIFRHGSFGPPHVLAIMTLLVLAIAYVAERSSNTGIARYVAVLGYSLTLFFHLIPGLTETGTRIPVGHPAFTGPEDPTLKALVGVGFLVYLAGAAIQVARIRRSRALAAST
ncbi:MULTISPECIES: hypothetical protein [Lysobacter]|uniref:hypothetical protein n=1 Tax=Lysobacter TaxID=68 RepID=UPI001F1940A1|nr:MULTISPECIES: hypothetical protein [Lysobacter]UJB21451.1 hypothetical protein L1A79_10540 [Lysobacter capsici]UJQ29432.1 hypothetical protein L2D09_04325 [Lysobacter gummosus]